MLAPGCALADEWTATDTWRESVYFIVDAIDWAQTREITRKQTLCFETNINPIIKYPPLCEQVYPHSEKNPLLGSHPSADAVDKYFVISLLAHAVISYTLPRSWREGWQYTSIGFEFAVVNHNRILGIQAKF